MKLLLLYMTTSYTFHLSQNYFQHGGHPDKVMCDDADKRFSNRGVDKFATLGVSTALRYILSKLAA